MATVEDSIRIQNVVASVTLNQRFDLNAIVKGNPGVEYRPEKFPGIVFRLKNPRLPSSFSVLERWFALEPSLRMNQKRLF